MDSPAHKAALRLLKAAARTRRELAERLVQRGYPPDESARVAEECRKRGLIDEGAIAARAVRAGLRSGKARAEIERSLHARGIEDSTIRAALADERAPDDASLALGAAREIARRSARATPQARLRRILDGLARRGYDEEAALNAARHVLAGEFPEDSSD